MDKTISSLAEAVAGISDGATVMIGGFGGSGAPIELIHALIDRGPKNLTVINNNAGNGRIGIAAMIDAGLVKKMICSFPRSSDPRAFTDRYLAGEIELELVPQGTLAERIRAGGAGIPAFYTPTGFGTELAEGKVIAEFDGRKYVQERWLKADFAIVKAHIGDTMGNLTYRMAGRNFNPLMCMAAAKRDRSRAGDHPGHLCRWSRRSRQPATGRRAHPGRSGIRMTDAAAIDTREDIKLSNAQIAWRAAQDIADGAYVNLGIGFPEMVAKFQPEGREAIFHTENGVLNFGEAPPAGEEDWDLINAGKKAITLKPGAAFFHHADSFAMVRGGHLDVAILGAYQIAENGDLANWRVGSKGVPAVGGAMDLVHGAKQVVVITEHVTKDGKPKLVERCTFPLTGVGCITRVYTSHAVIDIVDGKFVVREKLGTMTMDWLQAMTGAKLHTDGPVADLVVPKL